LLGVHAANNAATSRKEKYFFIFVFLIQNS